MEPRLDHFPLPLPARENPFRTERVLQVNYRLVSTTWPEILARLHMLNRRAAVIGPHGSGKTTLLEALIPRLQQQGFHTCCIRLDEEHPKFAPGFVRRLAENLSAEDFILFDGAEQIGFAEWQWFLWRVRKAGGLIITRHQSGRLPTLFECRPSPKLLAEIAGELLNTPSATVAQTATELFRRHNGNLRDALREWYDLQAHSPEGLVALSERVNALVPC